MTSKSSHLDSCIKELLEIIDLLECEQNRNKRMLMTRMQQDLYKLISKYEYMYNKYVIKKKPLFRIQNMKEKEISIVQNSMKLFFPYILAFNVAQMSY